MEKRRNNKTFESRPLVKRIFATVPYALYSDLIRLNILNDIDNVVSGLLRDYVDELEGEKDESPE